MTWRSRAGVWLTNDCLLDDAMHGWIPPPPREPKKSEKCLARERRAKVAWLERQGVVKSERIKQALLKVRREDFLPRLYRDSAYSELPVPLPGRASTISCPHSYPLFYEPLGLDRGQKFLEVGFGSGYGTALAREVVGTEGLVVAIEIDPVTYDFGASNLRRAGYKDIVLVCGDGGLGYPELSPYDRISVTAACDEVPPPLIEQLADHGRLIVPIKENDTQMLTLLEKNGDEASLTGICEVLYVDMKGQYGVAGAE